MQAKKTDGPRFAPQVALTAVFAFLPMNFSPDAAMAGGDWTHWGGPSGDFKVASAKIASSWPEEGPKTLWSRELGEGYSAVICEGDRLYTMYGIREKLEGDKYALDGKEAIVALDAKSGATIWEQAYDAPWTEDMRLDFGPGPHSTPLLVGDRLYTVGCMCKVHCLDKKTGQVVWVKDLVEDFDASRLQFGYGASPLAYKDTIILPVGGEGQSIIALKMADGSLAWKNQDFGPTFASPMIIDVDGEEQLVVFTEKEVSGLNPTNGELLWTHEHGTEFGANISTPVWCDDNILFISAAYGMGSRGLKLTRADGKTNVEELWFSKKMRIHHANAIALGDHVYGSSGDFGPAFFCAVNVKTGKMTWRERGLSKATCVYGDGKMIILDEDGQLVLAKVSPDGMETVSKHQVCDRNAWTVPTLVGDTLYIRDRKNVLAVDVK